MIMTICQAVMPQIGCTVINYQYIMLIQYIQFTANSTNYDKTLGHKTEVLTSQQQKKI